MTREMIINELNNRGYNAVAQNAIKNSVEFEGISIRDNSNIAPLIYTETIIERAEEEEKTLDEVVSAIVGIYESSRAVDFDVDSLFNRDFVLSHIYIGLQKESTEELIKRSCGLDGIESYLYIRREKNVDESFSVKMTDILLSKARITLEEAWSNAEANTNAETKIESMAKVMSKMMGFEYSEEMDEMTPFFVLSNTCKVKGASAVLNKKVLAEFGQKYHTNRIVVLPSSVHEMLIVPYTEDVELDAFSEMVGEVNNTEVDPTERLTDRAYIITL